MRTQLCKLQKFLAAEVLFPRFAEYMSITVVSIRARVACSKKRSLKFSTFGTSLARWPVEGASFYGSDHCF